ncbi:uncharacterized protein LOC128547231 isoform X2 [Mercenaria mercenaria]|nr:uncharacterized protein LOC128547231 isoform X2 [Mercenaria mercenaria]
MVRNDLFHSPSCEIEEEDAHKYINLMIDVLAKVSYREESKDAAIEKLNALKKMGISIHMNVGPVNSEIEKKIERLESELQDVKAKLTEFASENKKQYQRNSLLNLVSSFQAIEAQSSTNEIEEENTTKDSEIGSGVRDAVEKGDYRLAISLLVGWTENMKQEDSEIKAKSQNESCTEQTKCDMPSFSRPHDGRLITLDQKQVKGLLGNCEERVLKGGFGVVHVSNAKVPGLDIRVVIKKIVTEGEEKIKMLSISNEKIASRIMHFAVVPLIAYMDESLGENKRAFYFMSPFLERGNLLELISKDKQCIKNKDIQLKLYRRIEILFQIASALDYLHTPVQNNRGIVIHMDLTTTNIVLDNALNARIIDFGLAREMNEGQTKVTFTESKSFGTPGYYPTTRYSSLTVHEDYYNFGVVIRELLTGRPPYVQDGQEITELRKLQGTFIKKILQENIWTHREHRESLITLSTECLKSRQKKLCSAKIVETLKNMHTIQTKFTGCHENKCEICMVNLAVTGVHSLPHQCKMKVCASCMRNSHVNPIKCPLCNEIVKPKIGHTFAALLIAGNDVNPNRKELAKSFKDDVEEIKQVLVSKCPCVIGIREEDVKIVAPSNPGSPEKLLPRLSGAINMLRSRKGLETLILYFTGHHSKKSGFELGDQEDILTLKKLQEDLKAMSLAWGKQENAKKTETRILVFLDCCNPPNVAASVPELSNEYLKIIQVNACRPDEIPTQPISGSSFQKFFIQALTRRSFKKQCHNNTVGRENPEIECQYCEMSGDFITVERLLKYISEHMAKCWSGNQPVMYINGISWLDASIGYNVDFVIHLDVKFEGPNQTKDVQLSHKIFYDIKELQKSILEKVIADCDEQSNVELTPPEFSDALALRIHTGSQGGRELRSMLNVASAMDGNREIVASYRTVSNILNGRVVLFFPTERIFQILDSKALLEETDEGRKIATLSLRDLDWVTDKINGMTDLERDLDCVTDEINGMRDLEKIHTSLLKVDEKWRHDKNTQNKELKIIFPCINGDRFHDFMVLDLHDKPGSHLQLFDKMAGSLQEIPMTIILPLLVIIFAAVLVFLFNTTKVTG